MTKPRRENVPERVILHCAATPDKMPNDADYDKWGIEDIEKWHKERGFKTVGYHYVIRRSGKREIGRKESQQGAHCLAMGGNLHSIGICLMGTRVFTPEQMDELFALYLELRSRHGITFRDWFGHCEFDPDNKPNCPGLDMHTLRDRLSKL